MWVKLDDGLLDHRKILDAGLALGRDGRARALGFYVAGLLYSGKQLTDGFLSTSMVAVIGVPLSVTQVMVTVGLWDQVDGGFQIHDYHDYNPHAEDVKTHRRKVSEERSKAGANGAKARWQNR